MACLTSSEVNRLVDCDLPFSQGAITISGRAGSFFHSLAKGPVRPELNALSSKSVTGAKPNASIQLAARKQSNPRETFRASQTTGTRGKAPNRSAPRFFHKLK